MGIEELEEKILKALDGFQGNAQSERDDFLVALAGGLEKYCLADPKTAECYTFLIRHFATCLAVELDENR